MPKIRLTQRHPYTSSPVIASLLSVWHNTPTLSYPKIKHEARSGERVFFRLGRLQRRYYAIAKCYRIAVHPQPSDPLTPEKKKGSKKTPPPQADRIEWEKKPARETRKQTTGAYVITTTLR